MRRFKGKEVGQAGVAQEQRKEAVVSLHWIGVFVKVLRSGDTWLTTQAVLPVLVLGGR